MTLSIVRTNPLLLLAWVGAVAALQTATSRRVWLQTTAAVLTLPTTTASAWETTAQGQEEYTNSITASRDTNISPKEAYDTILLQIPIVQNGAALDLGAGAGVSTTYLYQRGYTTIDAVDWSRDAWDTYVKESTDSVQFHQATDDAFLKTCTRRYNAIVYNFAVNADKAVQVAKNYLEPDGLLLAPVNDQRDYWYKQSYWVLNASGDLVWKSRPEVGAWSVQFQPDVTSPSCTGIWCGSMNGFLK